jgi:colanic acid/amylovoran biosynthesis glycosyltransferase
VDPRLFRRGRRNEGNGMFEVVCVASLEEVKGHQFLLEACRILTDGGLAIRCHLIGEGPEEEQIRKQRLRLELESVVILHGGLPRQAVAAMLSRADAAVLASHPTRSGKREGIPVALMEAMAAELPVVTSKISGIPELVADGETGLLVSSGDPVALAQALEMLATDASLRRRLGHSARARILADFDGRTSALRLAALFTTGVGPEATPLSTGRVMRRAPTYGLRELSVSDSRESDAGRATHAPIATRVEAG